MQIRIPTKLKVLLYVKENYTLIKMINTKGVIKSIFCTKDIKIFKVLDKLILKDITFKKKKKVLLIYNIIIKNLMYNLFKFSTERLLLNGVGYKVWKKKNILKFKLGYSTPIFIRIPTGILVSIYKFKKLKITSLSLHYLRIFKYILRNLRTPDVYKKKGVRFYKEIIKLKEGKKNR